MRSAYTVFGILCISFFSISSSAETTSLRPKTESTATVSVVLSSEKSIDSLRLYVYEFYFLNNYAFLSVLQPAIYTGQYKNGRYSFAIHTKDVPLYFCLKSFVHGKDSVLLDNSLIEAGDQLTFSFYPTMRCSGKGAEKISIVQKMELAAHEVMAMLSKQTGVAFQNPRHDNILPFMDLYRRQQTRELSLLQRAQFTLSVGAYNMIKADVMGRYGYNLYHTFYQYMVWSKNDSVNRAMFRIYDSCHLYENVSIPSTEWYGRSRAYGEYLTRKINCDVFHATMSNSPAAGLSKFVIAKQSFSGLVRERLICIFLKGVIGSSNQVNFNEQMDDALNYIKTPYFYKMVHNWWSVYRTGSPVMDFSFQDTSGRYINLADFKNRVVIIDFHFTGCGACAKVAQEMPKVETKIDKEKVIFIGISVDKDRQQWIRSVKDGIYTTGSAINLFTGGTGSDHPFIKKYVISGYPQLLVIGKNQRIYSANPPTPWPGTDQYQQLISLINKASSE